MDALLTAPPDGVTISSDLDGLSIATPRRATLRAGIASLISSVLMMILPMAGAVLGIYPFAVRFLRMSLGWFLLGFVFSLVPMLLGLGLGMLAVYVLSMWAERLLGLPQESTVRIDEHAVTLDRRVVRLSEMLFVEQQPPSLVLHGGERVPIAPWAPEAVQRWLASVLQAVVSSRQEGDPQEVPRALRALQQPEGR